MAEYIEREVLIQTIQKDPWIGAQGKDYALCDIAEQPTADVASVVHGEWIDYKCSVCNKTSPTLYLDEYEMEYRIRKTPYCPYCGAKMDGKGDNNG